MSFLKRIFSQPEHPAWADFLSQSDFIEFSKNLTEVLDRYAAPYNLNLQEGYWRPERDEDKTYGIMNMAQTWRQIDPADRKDYLDHFVQTILKMTTCQLEHPLSKTSRNSCASACIRQMASPISRPTSTSKSATPLSLSSPSTFPKPSSP